MSEPTYVLFNATSRPVYVRVGDRLRRLPEVPEPRITDTLEGQASLRLAVPAPAADVSGGPDPAGEVGEADDGLFELVVGTAVGRETWDLPTEAPGVHYLVDAALLARLPHRSDLLAPASYDCVPADDDLGEQPVRFALHSAYRAVPAAGAEVENLSFRKRWDERLIELRAEAASHVRSGTPRGGLPDPWQVGPEDGAVGGGVGASAADAALPVETDSETEDQLRRRLGDHPDVAVLLRSRRRRIAERAFVFAGDERQAEAHAEAHAWFRAWHGIDESPSARRARADAMVDALMGRTEVAAARGRLVREAEEAAVAWTVAATGRAPSGVLARRLREAAVAMRADLDDDRDPGVTLIRLVIEAIEKRHHP